MHTEVVPADRPQAIGFAAATLRAGGLVAFPTDTVYGLGAFVTNARAIEQLFMTKDRQSNKAIAVLIGEISQVELVALEMNEISKALSQHFWPGPLTLVVPRQPALPNNISPLATVGVRMPDHPIAISLMKETGPLAVTSANLSGFPSASTAQEVMEQLGSRIPLILDGGRTPGGKPSTVVDCTSSQMVILREGPVSNQELERALA